MNNLNIKELLKNAEFERQINKMIDIRIDRTLNQSVKDNQLQLNKIKQHQTI